MKRLPLRKLVKPPRWGVVWFPAFSPAAQGALQALRAAHDPLAALPPHLWLVFPFAAHHTETQLVAHLKRRAAHWPAVPVVFAGLRNLKDEFVLLQARTGAASVTALHDRLYSGILAPYLRDDLDYLPHITLARARDAAAHAQAWEAAEDSLGGEYRARLDALTLLRLSGDGIVLRPTDRVEVVARIPLG
jgi:2'-5' RNA ligase